MMMMMILIKSYQRQARTSTPVTRPTSNIVGIMLNASALSTKLMPLQSTVEHVQQSQHKVQTELTLSVFRVGILPKLQAFLSKFHHHDAK